MHACCSSNLNNSNRYHLVLSTHNKATTLRLAQLNSTTYSNLQSPHNINMSRALRRPVAALIGLAVTGLQHLVKPINSLYTRLC